MKQTEVDKIKTFIEKYNADELGYIRSLVDNIRCRKELEDRMVR
jgi:hypothetical protein